MRVLIAEDEPLTREGLVEILANEGYQVFAAADGDEALAMLSTARPDFVCLDVMMPKRDGYAVCKEIRRRTPELPILFISAKGEEIDKVLGLELGADDYIVKPFGIKEVVARIRAITRRCLRQTVHAPTATPFTMHDLTVYPSELRARRKEESIDLSLREVKLLELLYMNPGKALDRGVFFDKLWGLDHIPNSRTLDQHVAQLRKRIELDPKHPAIIQTVHGVGYRYDEKE